MRALSIRQPWAWLICHGYKDVENRNWRTGFRGRVQVHAGKTMTRAEYEACVIFCSGLPERVRIPDFPSFESLKAECGGIVGEVAIVDCVTASESHWFCGDFAFVLRDPKVLSFKPCRGGLGFFVPKEAR